MPFRRATLSAPSHAAGALFGTLIALRPELQNDHKETYNDYRNTKRLKRDQKNWPRIGSSQIPIKHPTYSIRCKSPMRAFIKAWSKSSLHFKCEKKNQRNQWWGLTLWPWPVLPMWSGWCKTFQLVSIFLRSETSSWLCYFFLFCVIGRCVKTPHDSCDFPHDESLTSITLARIYFFLARHYSSHGNLFSGANKSNVSCFSYISPSAASCVWAWGRKTP